MGVYRDTFGVYVEPDELWDWYQKEHRHLEEVPQIIAENMLDSIQIYVEVIHSQPRIVVEYDGIEVESAIFGESTAEGILDEIYGEWFDGDSPVIEGGSDPADDDGEIQFDAEDEILDRELALSMAVEDLFMEVWDRDATYTDKDIEEYKKRLLWGLAGRFPKNKNYMPMIIVDVAGGGGFYTKPPF